MSLPAHERLVDASAIVVGAGDLGSPAAAYLVAAGVGRVGIVDDENAEHAAAGLGSLNASVVVEPYPVALSKANAESIVAGAGVVLDCSGSTLTGYVLNDACCAQSTPFVEAEIVALEGIVMSVNPGESACLRCAFPDSPEADAPVTAVAISGPVGGLFGAIQALEAIKLLTDVGEPLLDRILTVDAWDMSQRITPAERRPDCSACAGAGPSAQLG